jgi:hypothetical protein
MVSDRDGKPRVMRNFERARADLFHARGSATKNDLSPGVDRREGETTSSTVEGDRGSYCIYYSLHAERTLLMFTALFPQGIVIPRHT